MNNSRWLSLIVLCAGFLLIVVDATIVNVALPSIQRDLGFTQAGLAWVVNGYLISYAGLLLLAGRIGDLVGRKRVYLAGLVLFVAASVFCGLSFSQGVLVAARFVQGVGGAISSAVVLGMIVNMFPDPADRARAMGIFAFVASAGGAIGLLAGGLITQVISWHWIFFVNLPIGAATILLAWRLLDSDEGIGLSQGADVVGAVTVTAALMLGVYAIVESDSYGLGSVRTLAVGGVSILLLGAFLLRQARVRNPILPLSLLRGRNLAAANVIQSLMVAAFFGFFFLGALDLQRVLGYGPMAIGLAFMPTTVTMGLFSVRFTAPLIMRFGSRAVLLAGLTLIATGMMWLWRSPMASDYLLDLLPAIAVLGLGGGLAFTSLTMIAMSDTTPADSGVVSGLLNTTTQMGAALGLAVLATISAAETGGLVAKGQSLQAALSGGYHLAWGIGAGLTLVALGAAAIVIRTNRAPAQPCPEAAEVERACA